MAIGWDLTVAPFFSTRVKQNVCCCHQICCYVMHMLQLLLILVVTVVVDYPIKNCKLLTLSAVADCLIMKPDLVL